ncbi:GDSL-type esterase/lipase family protein [Lysinibacillus yapensis]|uniref:GDSL-type esterase/lipase family protein n=1 Tax=Ureibacillus yapensis TaxID=2304605 RepID=UPI0013145B99|nr:GDSL-type esterase/lipase family protein [Lysinibacillus yapensis]
MKKGRNLLWISLAANVVFILATVFVLTRKGGADILKNDGVLGAEVYTNYYLQKKDIFESTASTNVDKIFIGDSITDHGEFQEFFPNEVVLNRGISKDTSKGVLNRINEILARNPKEVYLLIGANDIRTKVDKATYIQNVENILKSFGHTDTEVYVQSILPVNNSIYGNKIKNETVMEFNVALKETAEKHNVHFIDLFPHFLDEHGQLKKEYTLDGLHLLGEGYKVWVNQVNQNSSIVQ